VAGPAGLPQGRPADVPLGARLRSARRARGLTLQQVATELGLTKGFLSRVEREEVSPSVASLVALCEVVGVRVGDLFDAPSTSVVRAGEGRRLHFGGTGAVELLLTPSTQQAVQVVHSTVSPGGSGGTQRYVLETDVECVYVLRGRFRVELAEETVDLAAGDALTFPGREPHTWSNASATEPAEVLWVLAPAP
jgi:transcriptional regulator with XRE-family HTH domain